jgi:putative sterol carrier protein
MAISSVQELFDNILQSDTSKIQGINGIFLFDLSGEGGGKYALAIREGTISMEDPAAVTPNVTLAMAAQDLIAMANGQLNPVSAFMQGKIKISGDMALAMRMQSILS